MKDFLLFHSLKYSYVCMRWVVHDVCTCLEILLLLPVILGLSNIRYYLPKVKNEIKGRLGG